MRKRQPSIVAPWKYGVGVWMVGVILLAFLYAGRARGFVSDTARIMFFHVPIAELSSIAFFASMVYAIHYLRRREWVADLKSVCAAEMGLVLAALATLTGSVFAASNWNSFWNWDPRETSIVVLLMIYGAYFGLRASIDDEERRATLAAVYNIFAGIVMPFLEFVVHRIPALQSLHPTNIWGPGGMSTDQRITLYSSLLGFLGIYIWMFQLRLRTGLLERQAEESPFSLRLW
jgi:heme exporter protein C